MELKKTNVHVFLTKGQKIWHYMIVIALLIMPVMKIWNLIQYYVLDSYQGAPKVQELFLFLFLGLASSVIFYYIQKAKLRFSELTISVSNESFKSAVEQTSKELEWHIDLLNNSNVKAYRSWNWTLSWGEMITIVRENDRILINSICDPSGMVSASSWGWNNKNVQTFIRNLQDIHSTSATRKQGLLRRK